MWVMNTPVSGYTTIVVFLSAFASLQFFLTAHCMGFKIVEVPIVFINRELGTSKMNSSIFFEALWGVIKLRWDSIFNKQRFTRRPLPKQITA